MLRASGLGVTPSRAFPGQRQEPSLQGRPAGAFLSLRVSMHHASQIWETLASMGAQRVPDKMSDLTFFASFGLDECTQMFCSTNKRQQQPACSRCSARCRPCAS